MDIMQIISGSANADATLPNLAANPDSNLTSNLFNQLLTGDINQLLNAPSSLINNAPSLALNTGAALNLMPVDIESTIAASRGELLPIQSGNNLPNEMKVAMPFPTKNAASTVDAVNLKIIKPIVELTLNSVPSLVLSNQEIKTDKKDAVEATTDLLDISVNADAVIPSMPELINLVPVTPIPTSAIVFSVKPAANNSLLTSTPLNSAQSTLSAPQLRAPSAAAISTVINIPTLVDTAILSQAANTHLNNDTLHNVTASHVDPAKVINEQNAAINVNPATLLAQPVVNMTAPAGITLTATPVIERNAATVVASGNLVPYKSQQGLGLQGNATISEVNVSASASITNVTSGSLNIANLSGAVSSPLIHMAGTIDTPLQEINMSSLASDSVSDLQLNAQTLSNAASSLVTDESVITNNTASNAIVLNTTPLNNNIVSNNTSATNIANQMNTATLLSPAAAPEQIAWLVRDGQQRAQFNLHPAELGQLNIQIQTRNNEVNVQIMANNLAQTALEQYLPQLREALQSQGFQLVHTQILPLDSQPAANAQATSSSQQHYFQQANQFGGADAHAQQQHDKSAANNRAGEHAVDKPDELNSLIQTSTKNLMSEIDYYA
ncbi:MAG: flagellar hook-length control protein FliK [Gammaproteobacteria bacterium]|nr:flagellar hook-length control protein FliK [Gammaproteobacteria bacterium]